MTNLYAARLVGALFLISTGSYLTASELIWDVLSLTNFVELVHPNKNILTLSALLEFVNSAAVVGIAIVMFPIIKLYSERVALTYLSFRIIEAIMLLIGSMALLSLISISKELLDTSVSNTDYFFTMVEVLQDGRYISFQLGMIPLAICGFTLCVTFYQHRMVPRLLSALGLLGYVLLILKVTADFFAINLGGELLFIPGALFELFLPFWLFSKGFYIIKVPEEH